MKTKKETGTGKKRNYFFLLTPLILLASLVAAFVVIVSYESDYIMQVEKLNLFLYTPHFLNQQLTVAGGMVSYIAAWLTQFLYVPWQGALTICLLSAILMVLMQQAFGLSLRWTVLLLVPLMAVLLSEFMIGYWIYLLKLRGYFFSLAVGSVIALLAVWVFRLIGRFPWWLRAVWLLFTGLALYPLAGCYGLVALLLMIVMEWRTQAPTTQKVILSVCGLLIIVAVPLLCYRYVYDQTPIGHIWWCGVPLFLQGDQHFSIYYLPYVLMLCACVVAAAIHHEEPAAQEKKANQPATQKKKTLVRLLASGLVHGTLIAALIFVCYHYWFKDENFHKEIQMSDCVEESNWQGVLDIAATVSNPTRQIVLYKYLALFKMGRIGEEMYDLPDGGVMPDSPAVIHMVQIGGQQLYLHYGIQNFCYRWCVEDGVEYGWRIKDLRLMLRCALVSEEWGIAKKFIDLLRKTRNHASWAEEYLPLVGHPELIAKHRELGPITRVTGKFNILASDQSLMEKFMLTLLAGIQTDDPTCAELALVSAIQLKDIATYWRAFGQYIDTHPNQQMPRIYQEVAYLYGNLEHDVDISQMPFDKSVVDSYKGFMQMVRQYQSMGEEQMRSILYPEYGKTYYYNYFLVRGLKTY